MNPPDQTQTTPLFDQPTPQEQFIDDWDDLLGTGTVMKQVLVAGSRSGQDLDMEAPRKFFALIDIETKCNDKVVESESHSNYLINSDADLFPGAHLVIPLMDIDEKARYIFDSKFGFGLRGNLPDIPGNAKLECIITLKLRCCYDEFLEQMSLSERIALARRKKERGKFWYDISNFQHSITIYQSLVDLCQLEDDEKEVENC